MKQTNNHEHSWIQDAPIKVCYHCGYKPQPTMKQTDNWEERFESKFCRVSGSGTSYWKNEYEVDLQKKQEIIFEIKRFIREELTNLLKTVAEAMGEEANEDNIFHYGISESSPEDYFNQCRSQIISNISEKYPEFNELVKGK